MALSPEPKVRRPARRVAARRRGPNRRVLVTGAGIGHRYACSRCRSCRRRSCPSAWSVLSSSALSSSASTQVSAICTSYPLPLRPLGIICSESAECSGAFRPPDAARRRSSSVEGWRPRSPHTARPAGGQRVGFQALGRRARTQPIQIAGAHRQPLLPSEGASWRPWRCRPPSGEHRGADAPRPGFS